MTEEATPVAVVENSETRWAKGMERDDKMISALRTVLLRDFKDYADYMVLYAGVKKDGGKVIIIEWAQQHPSGSVFQTNNIMLSTYSIKDLYAAPYWYDVILERCLDDYINSIEAYQTKTNRHNTIDLFYLAMCKMARNNHYKYATIYSNMVSIEALQLAIMRNLSWANKSNDCGAEEGECSCTDCEASCAQPVVTTKKNVKKRQQTKKTKDNANGKKKV